MIILHSGFYANNLFLWGEKPPEIDFRLRKRKKEPKTVRAKPYPFSADLEEIKTALKESGIDIKLERRFETALNIYLPTMEGIPIASSPIIYESDETDGAVVLKPWIVNGFRIEKEHLPEILPFWGENADPGRGVIIGKDLSFVARLYRFASSLVAVQKYLPGIIKKESGRSVHFYARWEPIISREDTGLMQEMAQSMPDSCRALSEKSMELPEVSPYDIAYRFVSDMLDLLIRRSSPRRSGRKHFDSLHDQWMYALTDSSGYMDGKTEELEDLAGQIKKWRDSVFLSKEAPFNLCFRIEEPELAEGEDESRARWKIRFLLQPADDPSLLIPAESAWKPDEKIKKILDREDFNYRLFLLHSLGQASSVSPLVEEGLKSSLPGGYEVDTAGAFEFMAEESYLLEQAGFTVFLPVWFSRKGTKKQFTGKAVVKSKFKASSFVSLNDLVEFDWEMALGDQQITYQELQMLAKMKSPLIKFRGQWVQLNAEEILQAVDFWKNKAEKGTLRELIRMELGISKTAGDIPVEGISANGWIAEFLKNLKEKTCFEEIEQPEIFNGKLRPYQKTGYSWLDFLKKWGLGACLADDMGLGKTIQVLSLIGRDWVDGNRRPVLIICPTSVMGNWQKEASRFTPDLPVMIHHGSTRTGGNDFVNEAENQAVVISSYALLHRDFKHLDKVKWSGIVLDEAQNIKNPETKQAKSARALKSGYRIALTGTPVENHVGDLWSIMEFLNPGFLGKQNEFKKNFHIPIQIQRDKEAEEKLKKITAPFILRRLKTDKSIISDLPEKMEMKVYCTLTKEQASLYSATAEEVIEGLKSVDGIQRKGIVLATISKLKQICNHPVQFLGDNSSLSQRSGKLERLMEMIEEIMESGERALVFTQFAEMGEIIKKYLQETFGKEVFFLHGGVPQKKREKMVERFQVDSDAPSAFILSLKAGGTGLNLTRASHVFHFDRWWNPAVENQATDRVFRIGQTKNVEVHKFVCLGTIEERIDEMIEQKKEIADNIVGTGEGWITELSDRELRDIFTLRKSAVGE